jgi:hypothetical protein
MRNPVFYVTFTVFIVIWTLTLSAQSSPKSAPQLKLTIIEEKG